MCQPRDWTILYLLKVDTKGYKISIFAGLTSALDAGAIAYIVFEFWPRGMDLMAISWLAWIARALSVFYCAHCLLNLGGMIALGMSRHCLLVLPLCCSWDVTPFFIDPALLF